MILPDKSLLKLKSVHKDLESVILLTAEDYLGFPNQFFVTEGLRTKERQKELFLARKSTTMNSRHLTGHAVDLAIWIDKDLDKVVDVDELSWKFTLYQELAEVVKRAAKKLDLSIEWGGDWVTFKDGPHFQLPRKDYP